MVEGVEMRTIICTTGTSITGNKIRFDPEAKGEVYLRAIRERVEEERKKTGKGFLDIVSAETKSLHALNATAQDAIILLHTDTDDGKICAEVVAEVITKEMSIIPQLKRIAGLQVKDDVAFRKRGIDQLFSVLKELTAGKEYGKDEEVILNITGGFKSVVPYVTLFGLLRRFDVAYIFEGSSKLIRMPPLPVQYDFERIGQAMEAIRRLRASGVMKKDDFFALIPDLDFHDRRWYECLLEDDGDSVTLSVIADHLLGIRDEERLTVMLHPHARDAIDRGSGSINREQFLFILERVSDALWRDSKRHIFKGTDLEVYKPGNTSQRLAGFTQGRVFYACELYGDHNEYERDLVRRQRAQYKVAEFTAWVAPSGIQIPETDEQVADLHQERLEKAEKESREGIKLWEDSQSELDSVRRESSARISEITAALESAQLKITDLEKSLADARQPWWKRLFRR